jgi:hypothetical protein
MKTYRLYCSKTFRYLLLILTTVIIVLVVDRSVTYAYFVDEHSLSSLPFWEDNRTLQTGRPLPLPIITTDQVNLTNFTLAIAACCRNVEKHLIGFQKNVRAIGALFQKYHLFLGESDSTDGTLKFIQQWAKNDSNHVNVYTAGHQRGRLLLRKLFKLQKNLVKERRN